MLRQREPIILFASEGLFGCPVKLEQVVRGPFLGVGQIRPTLERRGTDTGLFSQVLLLLFFTGSLRPPWNQGTDFSSGSLNLQRNQQI